MHQDEADYENASKCVIMHHIQNAASRRMHQNASSARTKNAAVENPHQQQGYNEAPVLEKRIHHIQNLKDEKVNI